MMVTLRGPQYEVFVCDRRFRILVAGRRFGKTYLALNELCRGAWGKGREAWYVAPTYRQAKAIAWRPLKELTRQYWAARPNESELCIDLIAGGRISLRGADQYDSLRGQGLDFIVLDEYACMRPEAWSEVLRPSLADRRGRALFIGTPKGFNHFYDLYNEAKTRTDWSAFQFTTEEGRNVLPEELAAAASEMDERTYRQEFQARFENLGRGLVYHAFDRAHNIKPLIYDDRYPLFWSLDFNVNPLCSVIGQNVDEGRVHVLDEIVLLNSNTWEACAEFQKRITGLAQTAGVPLIVHLYGDASSQARHTTADQTDWHIVLECLGRLKFLKLHDRVPRQNPTIKARVNAVDALLCNYHRERRLLVDPRCKQLIQDFERVTWASDGHSNVLGTLDKSDPMRTHVSDALGYCVVQNSDFSAKARVISRMIG